MPSGIPVATVALGSAGPVNAALFAIQILALSDEALAAKFREHKQKLAKKVEAANARVADEIAALQ
jgi:phosphoribosylcarboxyaminoimidazole (NCAIR) mutase